MIEPRGPMIDRRTFLAGVVATAIAAGCSGGDDSDDAGPEGSASGEAAAADLPPLPDDLPASPFTLGVASGDPLPDAVVLWTRLAPDPLATAGACRRPRAGALGGRDRRGVRRRWWPTGAPSPSPSLAHSVHVDVAGLEPGPRVLVPLHGAARSPARSAGPHRAGAGASPRTGCASPSPPARTRRTAPYTAYAHLAAEDARPGRSPRRLHLRGRPAAGDAAAPRATTAPRPSTLPTTATATPSTRPTPTCRPPTPPSLGRDLGRPRGRQQLRRDASQDGDARPRAFLRSGAPPPTRPTTSTMPLRLDRCRPAPDLELYRRLAFGDLADVLRPRHPPVPHRPALRRRATGPPCPRRRRPGRTMLGAEQERWLLDGLADVRRTLERDRPADR